jgi:hypothetical protein
MIFNSYSLTRGSTFFFLSFFHSFLLLLANNPFSLERAAHSLHPVPCKSIANTGKLRNRGEGMEKKKKTFCCPSSENQLTEANV